MTSRDERQASVAAWAARCFGVKVSTNLIERVSRLLEEALELAQAEGMHVLDVEALVEHVYSRSPGEPAQEIGGVGVTVLAYCAARGLSADAAEAAEVDRILSKTPEHFRARQDAKWVAGVALHSEVAP